MRRYTRESLLQPLDLLKLHGLATDLSSYHSLAERVVKSGHAITYREVATRRQRRELAPMRRLILNLVVRWDLLVSALTSLLAHLSHQCLCHLPLRRLLVGGDHHILDRSHLELPLVLEVLEAEL